MKTIRIFGLPSHQTEERTSGVDFVRIVQPLEALNNYEYKDTVFKTTVFDMVEDTTKIDWLDVAQEYDIIYLNYIINPWGYAAMGAMARHYNRRIVMDLDDALWYVRPDNPTAGAYKKNGENIGNLTAMLNDVDHVTVTNDYLRNVVIAQTNKPYEHISVLKNYIDLETMYSHRLPFKDTATIRIMHHGSTTHFEDLLNEGFGRGVDRIMKEYPHVTIEFVGTFIPKYRERWGMRYSNSFGDRDIYKWARERFPELATDTDIVVVPLEDNVYTRCKSGLKYLENGSIAKPGVYQNMAQYRELITHGENGYLASSENDWYRSLKHLIDDTTKRREMGERAYETTRQNTIQEHIVEYAEFFTRVLDK